VADEPAMEKQVIMMGVLNKKRATKRQRERERERKRKRKRKRAT
jgi:hypothetical protein